MADSTLPESLINALQKGTIVPFVGAGVSMAVKRKGSSESLFPSWSGFLHKAAEKLDAEGLSAEGEAIRALLNIKKPDYLYVAESARKSLGSLWFDLLKSQFNLTKDDAEQSSLLVAKLVWQLGSKLVITSNYERVLQWAINDPDLESWNIQSTVEKQYLLAGKLERHTLWKLHGDISDAANIILTPDGYQRLYPDDQSEGKYKAALDTLRYVMASKNLLFIGFSLDDEDVVAQLRLMSEIYEDSTGPHYVLVRKGQEDKVESIHKSLKAISYKDYGAPLIELLEELASHASQPLVNSTGATSPVSTAVKSANFSLDKRPFNVPYAAKGEMVIGRKAMLDRVHQALHEGRRSAIGQAAAFQGLGGLGKTQLAVEYAHEYRDDYPNGIIWLNADQQIDPQLIELGEKTGWVSPLSEHKDKLILALRRLKSYDDCLIIFDNLESLEDIDSYLPEPDVTPHILITSREVQQGFTRIPLDTLSQKQSVQLLVSEAGRSPEGKEEEEAAKEIANRLGGLPLALELAGAYLHQLDTVSWREYLRQLETNLSDALPERSKQASFTKHESDLYATLKVSEGLLKKQPLLAPILDILTWSGSASMGIELLAHLMDCKESELTNALAHGCALRILMKEEGSDRYAIHRLVRQIRREEQPLDGIHEWASQIAQRLGDWFQERRENFELLEEYEAELEHIRIWQINSEALNSTEAVRLLWLQAYPIFYRGDLRGAKTLVEQALAIHGRLGMDDNAVKIHLLNDYSALKKDLGHYNESLKHAKLAWELRHKVTDKTQQRTLQTLGLLADGYRYMGDLAKSIKLGEETFEKRQHHLGEEHRDTLAALSNLALAYHHNSETEKAMALGEAAVEKCQDLFGSEHPHTLTTLNNLALYCHKKSQINKAINITKEVLEKQQKILGEEHPDTLGSLNNIAGYYCDSGQIEKSLEPGKQALIGRRWVLGNQHPATNGTVKNLAHYYFRSGKKIEALQLLNEQLQLIGKEHPSYHELKQLETQYKAKPAKNGFRQPQSRSGSKSNKKKKRKK